ncbi:MAG: lipopolysaccharide kinase InaA family protein [Woeseiaceae bacterium]|nr:lipopolysaccharide kinase InaA family protein [Woeseiaceae bacterium]
MSQRIAARPSDSQFWFELGAGLYRFHKAGVCHADLNAYNVQIGPRDELWLLDFDRGSLRAPGTWQQKNLARLHRSLRKVRELDPHVSWTERDWKRLLDGYFQASRSA